MNNLSWMIVSGKITLSIFFNCCFEKTASCLLFSLFFVCGPRYASAGAGSRIMLKKAMLVDLTQFPMIRYGIIKMRGEAS